MTYAAVSITDLLRAVLASPTIVTPEQSSLGIGDHFVRIMHGMAIYGEVLDPAKPYHEGELTVDDLEDLAMEAEVYDADGMKEYRFTRCFSQVCPDGEMGDTHVGTVLSRITPEQFEMAKAHGWPTSAQELRWLVGLQKPAAEVV